MKRKITKVKLITAEIFYDCISYNGLYTIRDLIYSDNDIVHKHIYKRKKHYL